MVADKLALRLGQPVVVENRPGANGIVGSALVAKSPADGYTLVTATADTHSINPHVYKSLPYNAGNSFEPLVMFGRVSLVWIGRSDLGLQSMQEVVARAKATPGKLTFGSWGTGSTAHVAGASLESATGAQLVHVPYQGAAPAIAALLGGHIDILPYTPPVALQNVKAGKAKALAAAGVARATPWLPDLRTLQEQGITGAEAGSWYGLMAPAGLPAAVRNRLVEEITAVLKMPEASRFIQEQGFESVIFPPAQFASFLDGESKRYGKIIAERGIRIEN
jgi:tripartite-type tricarboxylate transporter receptor subunit TctC